MKYVQLLFSTTHNPGSALLRLATWSDWSHVALVDKDEVIEAVMFDGVRSVPVHTALERASKYELVELPARNPDQVIEAARAQIGKPYDWTGVVGLGMHRDWQQDDAWFCSELVAWSALIAGERWFRCEALRRVTPQHLWMLAPHPKASLSMCPTTDE